VDDPIVIVSATNDTLSPITMVGRSIWKAMLVSGQLVVKQAAVLDFPTNGNIVSGAVYGSWIMLTGYEMCLESSERTCDRHNSNSGQWYFYKLDATSGTTLNRTAVSSTEVVVPYWLDDKSDVAGLRISEMSSGKQKGLALFQEDLASFAREKSNLSFWSGRFLAPPTPLLSYWLGAGSSCLFLAVANAYSYDVDSIEIVQLHITRSLDRAPSYHSGADMPYQSTPSKPFFASIVAGNRGDFYISGNDTIYRHEFRFGNC
jgi:hypothetical protein